MGVVTFITPEKVVLEDAKALRLHKKNEPSDYELVYPKGEGFVRYYADSPLFCVGEFIKTNPQFGSITSFVYVGRVDANVAYALYVEDGEVINESFCVFDEAAKRFSYYAQNTCLFCSDEDLIDAFGPSVELYFLDVIDVLTIPSEYQLSEPVKGVALTDEAKKGILGGGLLIAGLVAGYHLYQVLKPPPPPPPPPPDPIVVWKESVATKLPLSIGLSEVTNLMAELTMLPADWNLSMVNLDGRSLSATLVPVGDNPLDSNLNVWLKGNEVISNNFDKESLTFSKELESGVVELVWYELDGFVEDLVDTLKILGASHVLMSHMGDVSDVQQYQFDVKFEKVSLGFVSILSDLFEKMPVTVDSIYIESSTSGDLTLALVFTLQGLTNEEAE